MSYNSVTLIGNLGADAKQSFTQSGTCVIECSLATTERRGEVKETHWHTVKVFGKTAEINGPLMKKGREVLVTGKLWNREWEDKNNVKRRSTEVVANVVRVVASSQDAQMDDGGIPL